jgi:hypothetical protein
MLINFKKNAEKVILLHLPTICHALPTSLDCLPKRRCGWYNYQIFLNHTLTIKQDKKWKIKTKTRTRTITLE